MADNAADSETSHRVAHDEREYESRKHEREDGHRKHQHEDIGRESHRREGRDDPRHHEEGRSSETRRGEKYEDRKRHHEGRDSGKSRGDSYEGRKRHYQDESSSEKAREEDSDTRGHRSDDPAAPRKMRAVEDGEGNVVAEHYNKLPELGRKQRAFSKIYYMRNFNNWVKSVSMKTFQDRLRDEGQERGITALDLGCGKGGDLLKWGKGHVRKVVCTDIAATSIEQCKDRYEQNKRKSRGRIFDAEFIVADSSTQRLMDLYRKPDQKFDLVSCQFVVHYSFETEKGAEVMVQNLCENLRKGGYFIGTTVNSQELRKRLDQSETNMFGNSVYSCTFESKEEFKDFGHKYDFHLEGVVDCPEYVLQKEVLERLAEKFGMKLVLWQTFSDFFSSNSRNRENRELLKRIKALEYFPSRNLSGESSRDYSHASEVCDDILRKYPNSNPRVGTLSQSEWDAASLYVVYAFKKVNSDDEVFDVPPSDRDDIPLVVISR